MTRRQSRTDRERQAREQANIDMGSFFSRGQLHEFDAAFKRALLSAIDRGEEYAPLGTFRVKTKKVAA